MKDRAIIEQYVKQFEGRLSSRLKPGIGVSAIVHPAASQGAVLEFRLETNIARTVNYQPEAVTVNEALKGVEQALVGGDISNVRFSGTNISLQGNRIVLIKGEDALEEWSNEAADSDFQRIFHLSKSESK